MTPTTARALFRAAHRAARDAAQRLRHVTTTTAGRAMITAAPGPIPPWANRPRALITRAPAAAADFRPDLAAMTRAEIARDLARAADARRLRATSGPLIARLLALHDARRACDRARILRARLATLPATLPA